MEQFGLDPLVRVIARLHSLQGWLTNLDSLWWMKLAVALALAILVAQLIGSGRRANEQEHWRIYR